MDHLEHLTRVYSEIGVPLDHLPYSSEMERIVALISDLDGGTTTSRDVWHDLLRVRKRGELPRVGRCQTRK